MRLYLETMQQVLPRMKKVLIDPAAGREVVPYLPLDSLVRGGGGAAKVGEPGER
jgi:hypothetical protein